MIITVCGFKGGVGKTTTAIHLACFFSQRSPDTLLVDGDPNRSSLGWAERGSLPFSICDMANAAMASRKMEHVIIDTEARPESKQLETLAKGCDLLVLPTTPDVLAIDALLGTVDELQGMTDYGVVLTMVDSRQKSVAQEAREALEEMEVNVFTQTIRHLTAYKKAALKGVPVYQSGDRFGKIAWSEYEALGKEILSYGE